MKITRVEATTHRVPVTIPFRAEPAVLPLVFVSVETDSGLVPDIKPNVPWVRLAQRVPVRIRLDPLPADADLVAGTSCTITIQP